MAKLTFRQFMAGIGDALPQMAQALHQYNLMAADKDYKDKQLALEERRVSAGERESTAKILASETATELTRQEIDTLLPIQVDVARAEKRMKILLADAQKVTNENQGEKIRLELEGLTQSIAVSKQQIAESIDQVGTNEAMREFKKIEMGLLQLESNTKLIGTFQAMATPEGMKVMEDGFNEIIAKSPDGTMNQEALSQFMQHINTNPNNTFTKSQILDIEYSMQAVYNAVGGKITGMEEMLAKEEYDLRFGVGKDANKNRETKIGTKDINNGLIDAHINNQRTSIYGTTDAPKVITQTATDTFNIMDSLRGKDVPQGLGMPQIRDSQSLTKWVMDTMQRIPSNFAKIGMSTTPYKIYESFNKDADNVYDTNVTPEPVETGTP